MIILKKSVESTAYYSTTGGAYCTEPKAFFTFLKLIHRVVLQKGKNSLYIQYIRPPRYDSTGLFRIILPLYQRIICGVGLGLLVACSQTTDILPNSNSSLRQSKPPPENWVIEAKLGVRTEMDSGSVTLRWQQTAGSYTINLRGPLGQGSAIIKGNDSYIIIEQSGKPAIDSSNPQALIEQIFGWSLPLSELTFWMRGLAAPQYPIEAITYAPSGNITSLQQSQWEISYSRYKTFNEWQLPGRINAHFHNTHFTLFIRKWILL